MRTQNLDNNKKYIYMHQLKKINKNETQGESPLEHHFEKYLYYLGLFYIVNYVQ